MNNKGFTLAELLAVFVLLLIIFMIVYPSVNKVIDNSKNVTYEKQIDSILSAAYDWSLKNPSKLPDDDSKIYVTLALLKSESLLDSNLINPKTREPFSNDLVISISNVGSSYKNKPTNSKKYGDYLYKVEDTESTSEKPSIILTGLPQDSKGNYVTEIDLNSVFEDQKYTATSSNGVDLTSRVIITIIKDDNSVDIVDTSIAGIYYIYYTVVDDFGNSNVVVRSVIVTDNSLPIINVPESSTVSLGDTNFDLMEGVTCTDNSGKCDISIKEDDSFNINISNKYVVEYSAKDPSGNTSTKKRVINVE